MSFSSMSDPSEMSQIRLTRQQMLFRDAHALNLRRVHVRSVVEASEVVVVFQMNNIPAETGKVHGPWIPPTTFPSHTW
jgi:hypothetical protein